MFFVCAVEAVLEKYGTTSGQQVMAAVAGLGQTVDVSGLPRPAIQDKIQTLGPGAVCLIGGYDLIPPFRRPNPTLGQHQDDDADIPTDAPYGCKRDDPVAEFAPDRAVSRIPDSAVPDAAGFVALLTRQPATLAIATPTGSCEEAAAEFAGAQQFVRQFVAGVPETLGISPPDEATNPDLVTRLNSSGRVHILLHGAEKGSDRSTLWGRGSNGFVPALTATQLLSCNLNGAVIAFSSCYAAMLDALPADGGGRNPSDQVSLACLARGAKAVFGATRSNWIGITPPFDGYGPGLIAHVWRFLAAGQPAAEALRLAKWAYLKVALAEDSSNAYALKTTLQAQCYGHPAATL